MARRVGDDATLLDTFRDGGSALVDLADPEERLALDLEHASLAKKLGSRIERLRATNRLVLDNLELGRLDDAYEAMATSEEIAQSLGHAAYRWRAVAMRAAWAYLFAMSHRKEGRGSAAALAAARPMNGFGCA